MCITRTCYAYFQICDIFWLTALDPRFKSLKVVENKEARDSIFKKLEQYLKEKEVEKNPENWSPNEIHDSNASRNMKIQKNNFSPWVMQHDSHARFYQFRQADIFDKPDQNIRDGHCPQVQRGHATAVGPAPAPVREESVADSVDGDEEEMTEQVQHYLTHDGHGCHGQGGRHASPVPEERDVARLGAEWEQCGVGRLRWVEQAEKLGVASS